MDRLIATRRLFTGSVLVNDGWVETSDDQVVAWGEGRPPREPERTWPGLLAPGYVDVHSHGGGGATFGVQPSRIALQTHCVRGTTTMVASLVTAGLDDLEEQVRTLGPLVKEGKLAGIHLEGPWLAPQYKGAHTLELLRDPTVADAKRLIEASGHTIRMVTMAPELPGAMDVIHYLVSNDVMVAIGHTAADFETTQAAIDAGARGTTHLFNAMSDLLHRAPGPALALWQDPRVWVELVCDGVHVHPALVARVMATKPDRAVLITDAMAAAGSEDGDYSLGGLPVEVRDGIARIAGTETIAGSTLTLDRAVRTAVGAGVDLVTALRAATCNPADYLGLTKVGRIDPGMFADLVFLDDNLNVRRALRHGVEWSR